MKRMKKREKSEKSEISHPAANTLLKDWNIVNTASAWC